MWTREGYRASPMATKPRHLKTPLQLWIADHRKALELSSLDLANLTGVTEDTARGWESRGRPSQDAIEKLEKRFGEPAPEGDRPIGVGDQAALVDAIRDLVDELRLSRIRQESFDEQVLALLAAATGGSPAREEQPSGSERAAPAGTAR